MIKSTTSTSFAVDADDVGCHLIEEEKQAISCAPLRPAQDVEEIELKLRFDSFDEAWMARTLDDHYHIAEVDGPDCPLGPLDACHLLSVPRHFVWKQRRQSSDLVRHRQQHDADFYARISLEPSCLERRSSGTSSF